MKMINPLSNLHLSEENRKWLLPIGLLFFVFFFVVMEYTILVSWTLQAVTIDSKVFFNATQYSLYAQIMLVAIAILSVYRIGLALFDFYRFNNIPGNRVSANYLYWIISGNFLSQLVFIAFAFIVAYSIHLLLGWNANDVFRFITNESSAIKHIYYLVPNIVQLPGVVAAIIIFLVWSFLMYANHYLSHVSRFMWLFSHRQHHVATALTNGTGFWPICSLS
ncbi:MAG: hypothetical protein IPH89_14760 [Bacteroidetes bacterium]|nr:hypothetical protein [Bacteroidota bacterium]